MITVRNYIANFGDTVGVEVISDESDMAGIQFHLHFDSNNLTFLNLESPGLGAANEVSPGDLAVVVSQATALPATICTIYFEVSGPSTLTLSDVLASDSNAQGYVPQNITDGEIRIGGANMQVRAAWNDTNAPTAGVIESVLYQGDGPDPATDNFNSVATVPVGTTEAIVDVATNQGAVFFFVRLRNNIGLSDPSNVARLETDLPQPAENLTVTIV
jgi:hypothetical protein